MWHCCSTKLSSSEMAPATLWLFVPITAPFLLLFIVSRWIRAIKVPFFSLFNARTTTWETVYTSKFVRQRWHYHHRVCILLLTVKIILYFELSWDIFLLVLGSWKGRELTDCSSDIANTGGGDEGIKFQTEKWWGRKKKKEWKKKRQGSNQKGEACSVSKMPPHHITPCCVDPAKQTAKQCRNNLNTTHKQEHKGQHHSQGGSEQAPFSMQVPFSPCSVTAEYLQDIQSR